MFFLVITVNNVESQTLGRLDAIVLTRLPILITLVGNFMYGVYQLVGQNIFFTIVLTAFLVTLPIIPVGLLGRKRRAMAHLIDQNRKMLDEKYKNHQEILSQVTLKLYRENGFNPLGCNPIRLFLRIVFVYAIPLAYTVTASTILRLDEGKVDIYARMPADLIARLQSLDLTWGNINFANIPFNNPPIAYLFPLGFLVVWVLEAYILRKSLTPEQSASSPQVSAPIDGFTYKPPAQKSRVDIIAQSSFRVMVFAGLIFTAFSLRTALIYATYFMTVMLVNRALTHLVDSWVDRLDKRDAVTITWVGSP